MKVLRFKDYIKIIFLRKLDGFDLSNINYLPRYIVLLIDIFLAIIALTTTHFFLNSVNVTFFSVLPNIFNIVILLSVYILFFFVFKTYSGLVRHSSFIDILKLAFASVATVFTLGVIQYLYFFYTGNKIFTMVGLVLYTVLSFTFLLIFRVFVKQIYLTFKLENRKNNKKRIAIIGIDDSSISLGKALNTTSGETFFLVGYLSERPVNKLNIGGKPVISTKPSLKNILPSLNLDGLLIIGEKLTIQKKNELINLCSDNNMQLFNAPRVEAWTLNDDITKNIKAFEIEDLLDREPILLNNLAIKKDLENKNILITGAAGSIGSELVRQIALYNPKNLILVDQAETPLYALELELNESFPDLKFRVILASISNKYRMYALFKKNSFSAVFHAAAYKHVPLIERNPREAIMVNLLGTIILAKLSSQYKVNKFVMISTDKAVNPTNVMGASKRAAEMYVRSFQHHSSNRTQFITTRFGNVLGSNGSVIPYFRNQIAKGGPVTVTHPDIIRYFMTIPEACQLVLEAGTMGKGGEILIFDMGEPVKILALAERMIELSGFKPYKDVKIEITGLRPGEKLYEELLSENTKTLPTHHSKILISKEISSNFEDIKIKTERLIKSSIRDTDKKEMVKLLKDLVPEFISKNSLFEELDYNDELIQAKI
ncbi:FlaA1/EpsC-like NDP-sugar epimerase [Gillisia sp. Hel_I_86]|uniref:polysaccharide biosynthesis protein n=1 Tax=Gillisia sp. Hel_I_86 TaxID=1249981 RepID=UPI00119BF55C|nr:nucleoside-diphosphate sugar epimerase/dehydratase [Gillisia sp. Hel_I_86]TVZ26036.1 FlaA1/EpsC-like NDP-sugar epimerase [Gillisia sp. Hel_I_86]